MIADMSDAEFSARAAARRNWPLRECTLADEGGVDQLARLSPAERVAMMWRLSVDAWVLSGRAIPDYRRDQAPGRVLLPHGAREP